MKAIVIFTNRISIDEHLDHEISFSIGKRNPYVEIPVNEGKSIWFAFDNIEESQSLLSVLPSDIEEIYILYHSLPNSIFIEDVTDLFQKAGKKCVARKSQHDDKAAGLQNPVYHLLPIIDDSRNDTVALENIFDELKKKLSNDEELENKLNFLHDCIFPKSIPSAVPAWLKEDKDAVHKFESLKGLNAGNPFEANYLTTLGELREALLSDY